MYRVVKIQKCKERPTHYDIDYVFMENIKDINYAYQVAEDKTNIYRTTYENIRCNGCIVGVEKE